MVSIVSNGDGDDRQTTLLKSVGCEFCAVNINADMETISPYYDFEDEQNNLRRLRQASIRWIRNHVIDSND